jgi:hypothetical protein
VHEKRKQKRNGEGGDTIATTPCFASAADELVVIEFPDTNPIFSAEVDVLVMYLAEMIEACLDGRCSD